MKVLFLEPYPTEGPSSRYRVEQYIGYLEKNGIKCVVRPFVSSAFYRILYKKGLILKKIFYFLQSCFKRCLDLFRAIKSDIIFIHLETFPIGPPLLESMLFILRKKIIYDLDDAIYLGKSSPANIFVKYLKWPSKIKFIIRISRHIITCNEYLANYAKGFNPNVTVIHTSVDTQRFRPSYHKNNPLMTIGWIGSHSTAAYLNILKDVFIRLKAKYSFKLKIIGAGDYRLGIEGLEIEYLNWSLADEIVQFQSLDIGVYPLAKEEWVLGKTGFKTIQYMSVGVACVASRIGTNLQIIQDGVNGFLADSQEEWVSKLSRLLEDADLRASLGKEGRKTVEMNFSLSVNSPILLRTINQVFREN